MFMHFIQKLTDKLKNRFNKISNDAIKISFLQSVPFWVGSILTGLVAVAYARLFAYTEEAYFYCLHHLSYWIFLISPVCFIIAWWLVKRFAKYSNGSGIPQVSAAIELANPRTFKLTEQLLSLKVLFIKIISSLFLAFGGGVIGREGPTIQIAASIFRKINAILPEWWPKISKKNMIMTGAAAGLAAAFNTPLGGFVFAIEELTKTHISFYKSALFTGVIIAGLTAQSILGSYLYVGYPIVNQVSLYMVFPVVLIALLCGAGSGIYSRMILFIIHKKRKLKNTGLVIYLLTGAIIITTLAYFVDPNIAGSGKEIMTKALFTSNKYSGWQLPLFKILGSVISFTTGAAGGVFAPALSIGAAISSFFSGIFQLSDSNSNLLIMAGMVAFLTGVTRSPFTSAILVLEMTDRHNLVFYLMLSALISNLSAKMLDKDSLYEHLKHQLLIDLHHHHRHKKEETIE
jgi:H+/Cl- antiporter ClcA